MGGGSGDEFERRAVGRTNDGEVSPVEGRYTGLIEPLGDRDNAGVGASEGQIGVGLNEVRDAGQVSGLQVLDHQIALGDGTEERGFCCGAELSCDEVCGLGDHEVSRYGFAGRFSDLDASEVVGVCVIGGGEKDASVNDEYDQSRPNPSANI